MAQRDGLSDEPGRAAHLAIAPKSPPHHHTHRTALSHVQAFSAHFRGLTAADLDALYEHMLFVDFVEDEMLARRGEAVAWAGVVLSGEVEFDRSGEFEKVPVEGGGAGGGGGGGGEGDAEDASEEEGEGEDDASSESDAGGGDNVLELLPAGTIIGDLAIFRPGNEAAPARHAASLRGASGGGTLALLTLEMVHPLFSAAPAVASKLFRLFGAAAVARTIPPRVPPRLDRVARRRESVSGVPSVAKYAPASAALVKRGFTGAETANLLRALSIVEFMPGTELVKRGSGIKHVGIVLKGSVLLVEPEPPRAREVDEWKDPLAGAVADDEGREGGLAAGPKRGRRNLLSMASAADDSKAMQQALEGQQAAAEQAVEEEAARLAARTRVVGQVVGASWALGGHPVAVDVIGGPNGGALGYLSLDHVGLMGMADPDLALKALRLIGHSATDTEWVAKEEAVIAEAIRERAAAKAAEEATMASNNWAGKASQRKRVEEALSGRAKPKPRCALDKKLREAMETRRQRREAEERGEAPEDPPMDDDPRVAGLLGRLWALSEEAAAQASEIARLRNTLDSNVREQTTASRLINKMAHALKCSKEAKRDGTEGQERMTVEFGMGGAWLVALQNKAQNRLMEIEILQGEIALVREGHAAVQVAWKHRERVHLARVRWHRAIRFAFMRVAKERKLRARQAGHKRGRSMKDAEKRMAGELKAAQAQLEAEKELRVQAAAAAEAAEARTEEVRREKEALEAQHAMLVSATKEALAHAQHSESSMVAMERKMEAANGRLSSLLDEKAQLGWQVKESEKLRDEAVEQRTEAVRSLDEAEQRMAFLLSGKEAEAEAHARARHRLRSVQEAARDAVELSESRGRQLASTRSENRAAAEQLRQLERQLDEQRASKAEDATWQRHISALLQRLLELEASFGDMLAPSPTFQAAMASLLTDSQSLAQAAARAAGVPRGGAHDANCAAPPAAAAIAAAPLPPTTTPVRVASVSVPSGVPPAPSGTPTSGLYVPPYYPPSLAPAGRQAAPPAPPSQPKLASSCSLPQLSKYPPVARGATRVAARRAWHHSGNAQKAFVGVVSQLQKEALVAAQAAVQAGQLAPPRR